jgi:threonine dehydrogenase-like Zn-dependent dehydrogenase
MSPDTDISSFVQSHNLAIYGGFDFVGTAETFTATQAVVRPGVKVVITGVFGGDAALPYQNVPNIFKKVLVLRHYSGTTKDPEAGLEMMERATLTPMVTKEGVCGLGMPVREQDEGKFSGKVALIP